VIEKFNLSAMTVLNATPLGDKIHTQLERYSGPFGFGAGHAIVVGIVADLVFGVTLALPLVALSAYLTFV
jgi:hypothetical protein